MSKGFVKNRETQTIDKKKEAAILNSSPDVQPVQPLQTTKKLIEETKQLSVPVSASVAALLESLAVTEDRSQRKIASKLLSEAIKEAARKHGLPIHE